MELNISFISTNHTTYERIKGVCKHGGADYFYNFGVALARGEIHDSFIPIINNLRALCIYTARRREPPPWPTRVGGTRSPRLHRHPGETGVAHVLHLAAAQGC